VLESWLWNPLVLTLQIASWTFLFHALFGIALAWALSGKPHPLKGIVDILITIPIVFPPIALGFLLLLLLGKNGILGAPLKEFGIEIVFAPLGVLIASFLAGLPLVVKPIQSALDEQDRIYSEASYVLGKGKLQTFYRVLLPSISKVIFASLLEPEGASNEMREEERRFLEGLRERVLVLFEGMQSPNNRNIEAKVELTLNFFEYLLSVIDERLEKKN